MNKGLEKLCSTVQQMNMKKAQILLYRLNRSGGDMKCFKYKVDLPEKSVEEYIKSLIADCCEDIEQFERVLEYKGEGLEERLYWIGLNDAKMAKVWNSIEGAECDCEQEWVRNYRQGDSQIKFKGVMVDSEVNGEAITLFTIVNPVKCVDHAFFLSRNEFKEVDGPLLILPTKVGAIRFCGRIYFISLAFLKLFIPKEEAQRKSKEAIDSIVATGRISDEGAFRDYAMKGHNPRRLLNCDEKKVAIISDPKSGRTLREKFGIEMKNGKLMVSKQEEVDRLIKLVTNRGMVDPFNKDAAMEVSGAIKWGGVNEL